MTARARRTILRTVGGFAALLGIALFLMLGMASAKVCENARDARGAAIRAIETME